MFPLLLYVLFAGLLGFSIHKKWYGSAAFSIAMLIWMLLMQTLSAYLSHPRSSKLPAIPYNWRISLHGSR